ncbi:MarR family winged helix-turn-helix transcriptional regulator [Streptomyces sp. NPDC051940]|uniref:MarR family winged helix-turn-helix transcriptional regulator n=1 Tax=Streptomyces sp. NPDC051940 TaxID=3155675 RepID=UPI00343CF2E7
MSPEPAASSLRVRPVHRLDAELEVLRHATFGLYGPGRRAALQEATGWPWSPVHYRLLRVVEASGELRPTVGELAASLLTDPARASRLVDEVVEAGLVRRRAGRLDRRRREVELTARGHTAMARMREQRVAHLERSLDDWPAADVQHLAALLARLNAAFSDIPPG